MHNVVHVETYLFPVQVLIVFVLFFQAFKEWMKSMVHSLYTLAGKSSSTIEVVELQLAGCVLVTVLARLGWLDARGTLDKLGIDILIELMNLLKLPLTNPTLIQQWCTDFRGRITPEIRYAKSVEIYVLACICYCIILYTLEYIYVCTHLASTQD